MPRVIPSVLLLAMFLLAGPAVTWAQDAANDTADPAMEAILQQVSSFQQAFNAGQVEQLTSLFLPTAEMVDEGGVAHIGREEMTALFTGFFKDFPGAKMRLELESVRQITPQLATGDLLREVTAAGSSDRAVTRSALTFAQQDGSWLIASIRDVRADAELSPHQQLEPLEWLVGDWIDEGSDSLIRIHCDWSQDGNFLLMDYVIQRAGEEALSSRQRIGWDPVYEQVRSWIFDADGGFGGGLWSKVADTWVVKSSAVLPDGATGSATFVVEPQGKDRFVMRGLDRILGDGVQPDVEMTIVRKPPQSE